MSQVNIMCFFPLNTQVVSMLLKKLIGWTQLPAGVVFVSSKLLSCRDWRGYVLHSLFPFFGTKQRVHNWHLKLDLLLPTSTFTSEPGPVGIFYGLMFAHFHHSLFMLFALFYGLFNSTYYLLYTLMIIYHKMDGDITIPLQWCFYMIDVSFS